MHPTDPRDHLRDEPGAPSAGVATVEAPVPVGALGSVGATGAGQIARAGELFALPMWRRWALASALGRLPRTMEAVAIVLGGKAATGSFAAGALMLGVTSAAAGLTSPLRGRALDRTELRRGLGRASLGAAAALGVLAVAVAVGAPLWVLLGACVGNGAASAGVLPGYRTFLSELIPARTLERAFSIDAVLVEVAFVSGPALASLLVVALSPAAALAVMGATYLVSGQIVRGLPERPPVLRAVAGVAPWRIAAAVQIYVVTGAIAAAFGLFESVLAARLVELGQASALVGPLSAVLALASGIGGVTYGVRAGRWPGRPTVRGSLLILAVGLLLVPAAAAGNVWVLGAAMFGAGLGLAPANAIAMGLLQGALPADRRSEGFAIWSAAIAIGFGAGGGLAALALRLSGAQSAMALAAALFVTVGVATTLGSTRPRR